MGLLREPERSILAAGSLLVLGGTAILVGITIWLVRHWRAGTLRAALMPPRGISRAWIAAFAVLALQAVGQFVGSNDPLRAVAPFGPGIGIVAVREDGAATPDGDTTNMTSNAPRFVISSTPGQKFRFYLTFRNRSLFPLTIIGLYAPVRPSGVPAFDGYDFTAMTLATAPDQAANSADLPDFHPQEVAPGADLGVVLEGATTGCSQPSAGASPAVGVPPDFGPPGQQVSLTAFSVVYEQFGLRDTVPLWPPFEVSADPRCS